MQCMVEDLFAALFCFPESANLRTPLWVNLPFIPSLPLAKLASTYPSPLDPRT